MNYKMTPAQVQSAIREKLSHIYGVSAKNASDDEFYKASALVVRDLLGSAAATNLYTKLKSRRQSKSTTCAWSSCWAAP